MNYAEEVENIILYMALGEGTHRTRSVTNRIIFWYIRTHSFTYESFGGKSRGDRISLKASARKNPLCMTVCSYFLHNPLFHNQIPLRQHHQQHLSLLQPHRWILDINSWAGYCCAGKLKDSSFGHRGAEVTWQVLFHSYHFI